MGFAPTAYALMHLCPHCCCTTMMALPQTGSDTGIRTQDLRDMSPTRTTSPPYRNKLVQVLISCFLVLPAIIQTRIDPLGGSGRFNYPACLSYKLAGSEGFEPSTVGLTGHRTYLMCLLPLMWSVMQGSNLRFSAPKADDMPLA